MPKLSTRSTSPLQPFITPARGLHDPKSGRTYFFDEFDRRAIVIGRGTGCDIRLVDRRVSHAHGMVTVDEEGHAELSNCGRNSTYVNGSRLDDSMTLTAGMHLHFGSVAMLVATDGDGAFPILVYSIPELCHYGEELYGNPTAASRFLGKRRRFIAGQAKAFRKASANWWREITQSRRRSNRIVLMTNDSEQS